MIRIFLNSTVLTLLAAPALAGIPVPLPVLGATGPVGLGIAIAGYAGYRVLRAKK